MVEKGLPILGLSEDAVRYVCHKTVLQGHPPVISKKRLKNNNKTCRG